MFIQQIREYMASCETNSANQIALWCAIDMVMHECAHHQVEAIRNGYYESPHASMFCKPCIRQRAFAVQNIEKDNPPGGRVHQMFALGHSAEVLTVAQLIVLGYDVNYQGEYSIPDWRTATGAIYCHPDVVVTLTQHQRDLFYEEYGWQPERKIPIEIKSTNPRTFETMTEQGVGGARPEYLDQATLEMASTGRKALIWIVVERGHGRMLEEVCTYDTSLFNALTRQFHLVMGARTPFEVEGIDRVPATEYCAGKTRPTAIENYECTPRVSVKGYTYGWDRQTGWAIPRWPCSYCNWRATCWANSGYELVPTGSGQDFCMMLKGKDAEIPFQMANKPEGFVCMTMVNVEDLARENQLLIEENEALNLMADRLLARLKRTDITIQCHYCGAEWHIDKFEDDHWMSCPKHPMRAWLKQIYGKILNPDLSVSNWRILDDVEKEVEKLLKKGDAQDEG